MVIEDCNVEDQLPFVEGKNKFTLLHTIESYFCFKTGGTEYIKVSTSLLIILTCNKAMECLFLHEFNNKLSTILQYFKYVVMGWKK